MKPISSRIELNPLESQETGTIWDFLKTSHRSYARPNPDSSITFCSYGVREISGYYYEFKIERTYEVKFKNQSDYDVFLNEKLIELNELIFAAHGDSSDAEIID